MSARSEIKRRVWQVECDERLYILGLPAIEKCTPLRKRIGDDLNGGCANVLEGTMQNMNGGGSSKENEDANPSNVPIHGCGRVLRDGFLTIAEQVQVDT